ncbi:MAG: hypothetical protein ACREUQ_08940 [Burkholderiales bacterium]
MEIALVWSDELGQIDVMAGSESEGAMVLASWISNDVQASEESADAWMARIRSGDGYIGGGNTSTVWRCGDVVLIESGFVENQEVLLDLNQLIELLLGFRDRISEKRFHDRTATIPPPRVDILAAGDEASSAHEQRTSSSKKK